MFSNYLKTSIRALLKQRGFTIINIIGLTLGLTCSIMILLWIGDEIKVGRGYKDGDRIYKAMFQLKYPNGAIATWGSAPQPLEEILDTEYPEIEHATLITNKEDRLLILEDQSFKKSGIFASDGFFDVFDMSFTAGEKARALNVKNSIVITEELAEILFGPKWQQKEVLGKSIMVDKEDLLTITAVVPKPDTHSSIQFDYVIPLDLDLEKRPQNYHWERYSSKLFVKLEAGTDMNAFNEKINDVIQVHKEYDEEDDTSVFMYPIERLHLYGKFENGINVGGRIEYIRIFGLVSVFVLVMACINFMNLATARSFRRSREVGIRKVVGARRGSLIVQFISESILVTFISMILAVVLTMALLPTFNVMTGKLLAIDFGNLMYWIYGFAFLIFTGLLSGFYPAFVISNFKPISVLKGRLSTNYNSGMLRKSLVVFQFFLSIFMIAGTMIVHYQVDYIKNLNLGLDKENVLIYSLNKESQGHYQAIKHDLQQYAEIISVTTCNQNPLNIGRSVSGLDWEGIPESSMIEFRVMRVAFDFTKTLDIEMVDGRDFSNTYTTDSTALLVNEAALRAMGIQHRNETKFKGFGAGNGNIIGVIKDFHSASVYDPIKPLLVILDDDPKQIYIRTAANKAKEAIHELQKLHAKYASSYPFEYGFMNEKYDQLYKSEMIMSKLANFFASLAIIISCLGLIGLASLNIAQKVKEIGVRKVMGASISSILMLLSRDYFQLVLLAFVISVPVVNYFIVDWLDQFEYKIELHWWLYPISGLFVLFVALLSVSWQSYKAANANPVNSLRDE